MTLPLCTSHCSLPRRGNGGAPLRRYVAFSFVLAPGIAMLADSKWMLVSMALFPIYIHFVVIPVEEEFMRKLFGAAYDAQLGAVPRWLLF